VSRDHFSDLVYADDTTLLVNSASEAASCLDSFKDTAAALGLRVSWPKTKLQNLGAGAQLPTIVVDRNAVESVDNFVYLGSVFTSDGYCRPDINRHIGRASSVMSSLQHVWKNQRLSLTTKRVFIMPLCSLYYSGGRGCEISHIHIHIHRFCVDIHGYIHIHRCLFCMDVSTDSPQSSVGFTTTRAQYYRLGYCCFTSY